MSNIILLNISICLNIILLTIVSKQKNSYKYLEKDYEDMKKKLGLSSMLLKVKMKDFD